MNQKFNKYKKENNHILVRRNFQHAFVKFKTRTDSLLPNDDVHNGGYLKKIAICTDFPFDQAVCEFGKTNTNQTSIIENSQNVKYSNSVENSCTDTKSISKEDNFKNQTLSMINGEQNNQFNIYNQTKLQDNYKIMKDVDAFMHKKIRQIKYEEY